MSSWCLNTVELTSTEDDIDALLHYLVQHNGEGWFTFFTKEESSFGYQSEEEADDYWYSGNMDRWGCKWNCNATNWERLDETRLEVNFESPWSPPITLYERIQNGEFGPDWSVVANWHEPGFKYVGQFYKGDMQDYSYRFVDSLDDIPQEIINRWNLSELLI
jgi:hypothetical protein